MRGANQVKSSLLLRDKIAHTSEAVRCHSTNASRPSASACCVPYFILGAELYERIQGDRANRLEILAFAHALEHYKTIDGEDVVAVIEGRQGRSSSDLRYPYRGADVRRTVVDVAAKVTSKGQVTVPKVVRDALGINDGDEVVFRVEGNRAVLARTPNFLDLAATVSVPAAKRNVAWDEVIRRTRSARAAARR